MLASRGRSHHRRLPAPAAGPRAACAGYTSLLTHLFTLPFLSLLTVMDHRRTVIWHMRTKLGLLVALLLAALVLTGCGAGRSKSSNSPFVPRDATVTDVPPSVVHPATGTSAGTPQPSETSALAPTSGRWIDVDVTNFVVRLMDGEKVTMTIAPVAVGAQINTGAYDSTATGLFHVYSMSANLTYDAPYKTYISNWVGFDPKLDNGMHSFLEDKSGKVVDASTGGVSNGCIRTGQSAAIYAFARIGMPVYVHT